MLPYGFTAETIRKSLTVGLEQMRNRGWHADLLQIMPDESAATAIRDWLSNTAPYDCIVIGAGVRIPVKNLTFFESVVNAVHRFAPNAAIGFNTRPEETADAVKRLLKI
ncbi:MULTISPECIES: hypothetical protein [Corallococcus]|uniref:hypothetical protein n=1 Tax=Corallococcus TaxID=83461 RepID=UPI0018F2BB07|nr:MULTISPECIES: hypothetical protein [Corallococcus]